jgi:BirA family biotin operon repressor/biotin-[acetyl-CoA-carboxylase] ligase
VGSRVLLYETVESTNDRAFRVGGEGTVIVADCQTAGRGRHGRSWDSKPGLGLWFSVAFENAIDGLAFAAPLAVHDALRSYCAATVKWPNDVLIDGKKCCGVLVESRRGTTVLGIGINVGHRPEDFPPEFREKATSVEAASGRACNRGELLRDVLTELDHQIMVLREHGMGPVWREWVEACAILGRRVRCGNQSDDLRKSSGVITDVMADGGLVLATDEGPRRVLLGELLELDGA